MHTLKLTSTIITSNRSDSTPKSIAIINKHLIQHYYRIFY